MLRDWLAAARPHARFLLVPHPRDPGISAAARAFEEALAALDSDPLLEPARVIWRPVEERGSRRARLRDLFLGDPRRPAVWRQRLLVARSPERFEVVTGVPARLSALRKRHADGLEHATAFDRFVARQAILALERAEYRAVGMEYKVPRLVREEILESPRFAVGVSRLADELERDEDDLRDEAVECLEEMAAGYSRFLIDLIPGIGRIMCRPGYGDEIDYIESQVEAVRELFKRYPVMVLPSHKSQLDGTVMARALVENGLPPSHIFAGINMSFGPFARILRRAGRIFIRRSTKEDPVYRWVLREYVGFLLQKRFPLEWYIEGTRSRTGKLMPPKLGLLRYVVDASLEDRSDDVALLPVSLMYDELSEVSDYSAEARGAIKAPEGLSWALKFYRAQRGHFGKIYVRFGEPIFLKQELAAVRERVARGEEPGDISLELNKIAFELSWRINFVTPATGSALVCLILLAVRDRALTLDQIETVVGSLQQRLRSRGLPLASSAEALDTRAGTLAVLQSLASNRTVDLYADGVEPVYRVAPGQHLSAAFYRNTAVHYFVNDAILEVALFRAVQDSSNAPGARVEAFWNEALHLRDLLKFEFFFKPTEEFKEVVRQRLVSLLPDWEERLPEVTSASELLAPMSPMIAFAVLRPFVEAYGILARVLEAEDLEVEASAATRIEAALGLGRQLVLQDEIRSDESVSKLLFGTGLQLAENRGLTRSGPDTTQARVEFSRELAAIGESIDEIEALTLTPRRVSQAESNAGERP